MNNTTNNINNSRITDGDNTPDLRDDGLNVGQVLTVIVRHGPPLTHHLSAQIDWLIET